MNYEICEYFAHQDVPLCSKCRSLPQTGQHWPGGVIVVPEAQIGLAHLTAYKYMKS